MSTSTTSRPLAAELPHVEAIAFASLAGRLFLAAIFLIAGTNKFLGWEETAAYMEKHDLPYLNILLPIAAAAELAGGLALLFGCLSRWASFGLILFLIPATVIFHAFWTQTGMEAQNNMHHFLKNLAIIGGLLMVMSFGPGPLSFDQWRTSFWPGKSPPPR